MHSHAPLWMVGGGGGTLCKQYKRADQPLKKYATQCLNAKNIYCYLFAETARFVITGIS
jgi:hypothetical protein